MLTRRSLFGLAAGAVVAPFVPVVVRRPGTQFIAEIKEGYIIDLDGTLLPLLRKRFGEENFKRMQSIIYKAANAGKRAT
jgi:hypothetical protein